LCPQEKQIKPTTFSIVASNRNYKRS